MTLEERFKNIFEPELIQAIREAAKQIDVPEGQAILEIGQTVRVMPLVLTGLLRVSRLDEEERELLLYYINPNESCAMTFTCCMQQFPSEIRAVAEEDTTLLAIPIASMDSWLSDFPTWKSFVMRTIRNRFNELLKTIDQIAFQKLDERLVTFLNEKSKSTGSALINVSHEQIANSLATSRVVVSRLLKRLENEKKLLLYRNQIKLLGEL
jgi:CRP/FNR family transcriptional regulator